jgi:hypothetical protein
MVIMQPVEGCHRYEPPVNRSVIKQELLTGYGHGRPASLLHVDVKIEPASLKGEIKHASLDATMTPCQVIFQIERIELVAGASCQQIMMHFIFIQMSIMYVHTLAPDGSGRL